jgi:ribosome recycling factor
MLKELLKDKDINEDEERQGEDAIQKLTDRYIAEVEKQLKSKEEDLMAV